jgi:hypothetical protein
MGGQCGTSVGNGSKAEEEEEVLHAKGATQRGEVPAAWADLRRRWNSVALEQRIDGVGTPAAEEAAGPSGGDRSGRASCGGRRGGGASYGACGNSGGRRAPTAAGLLWEIFHGRISVWEILFAGFTSGTFGTFGTPPLPKKYNSACARAL